MLDSFFFFEYMLSHSEIALHKIQVFRILRFVAFLDKELHL
jgi:hypothetical protein